MKNKILNKKTEKVLRKPHKFLKKKSNKTN